MATPTAIIFLFMTDRAWKKQTLQYGNANCNHISVYNRQSSEETDTTIWQRQRQSYFCLWQTELGRNRHYNMAMPTADIFLFMTDRAWKKQTLQYGNANCNHISVYNRQSWEDSDTTIWQRQLQTYFCLWQTELGRNRHYNMATPTANMRQHGLHSQCNQFLQLWCLWVLEALCRLWQRHAILFLKDTQDQTSPLSKQTQKYTVSQVASSKT